ncbi:MAG: neutral zinc metallopeptidase [Paracoccaceae bacterium]
MEWRGRRESSNIEDRRSQGGFGGFGGGQRSGSVGVGGGLGLVAIVVVGWFFGIDLTPLLNGGGSTSSSSSGYASEPMTQADMDAGKFVSVTLADTEDIWAKVFQEQLGKTYHPVTLVLYKGITQSDCGDASGATGPFYCPVDKKVYLDTNFFVTMKQDLGINGDFANAYVVAHEVGHHVQDELGILAKANDVRGRSSETLSNEISVRIELQADCLAGIWGRDVQQQFGTIEPGDFDEAINAAKQIGDDTLQRNAGQVPMPDSFTHGTSAQRSKWFQTGLKSGQVSACDTFAAAKP